MQLTLTELEILTYYAITASLLILSMGWCLLKTPDAPAAVPRGKHDQWCVDHDHVTNKVRELLCKDCNIVLGIVSDSPTHLKQLIQYIAKHND